MSGGTRTAKTPRAMIHQRIIDAAAAQPSASLEEIAHEVPGASVDLVDRVLAEYGDPAGTENDEKSVSTEADVESEASTEASAGKDGMGDTSSDSAQEHMARPSIPADDAARGETVSIAIGGTESTDADDESANEPDDAPNQPDQSVVLEELTEKRRETLRAINAYPEASQRQLAQMLGVTAATISQRVSAIEGFDWSDRAAFVDGLFDETRSEFDAAFGLDEESDAEHAEAQTPADTPEAELARPASDEDGRGGELVETVSDGGQAMTDNRLSDLESRLESLESALDAAGETGSMDDPELISKVIHACVDAETITTEEEHRIIEYLVD